jgi:glycolate oxidase iron-sulfur subunit
MPIVAAIPTVGHRLAAMLELAPANIPPRSGQEPGKTFSPTQPSGEKSRRVALLTGCAQAVLKPSINEATIRLLNRRGIEVVLPKGEGCCGALVHHMGQEEVALTFAKRNIDAWMREIEGEGLEAILITASGCGTTIKDYGFMLRDDPVYAEKAKIVSALSRDITEFLGALDADAPTRSFGYTVAYHSACSMQHGQKITDLPKRLLKNAGFRVKDVPEGHICCGSAGTYNILQPELASKLRARKVGNIERIRPDLIATGNIGCMTQIAKGTSIPIVHTVELLDWATGGPVPEELEGLPEPKPDALSQLLAAE